jgi:hypothetical protein
VRTVGKLAVGSLALGLVGFFIACGTSTDGGGGSAASGLGGRGGSGGLESGLVDQIIVEINTGGNIGDAMDTDGCAKATLTADLRPADLLFLIDRTGSMNCNAPPIQTTEQCEISPKKADTSKPSKWETTRDGLKAAIQALKKTNPVPSVGVMLFNSDDGCGAPDKPNVDMAELLDPQTNLLLLSLDQVTCKGDTPLVGTCMNAYQYLYTNAASFTGNLFVVLLTDGAENCHEDFKPTFLQKVKDAASIGIRTFVLGAPGSESGRSFLSQIAWNGGTASSKSCDHPENDPNYPADKGNCHIDMTVSGDGGSATDFGTALKDALAKVSGSALSCEMDVPEAPDGGGQVNPGEVNVLHTMEDGGTEWLKRDDTLACSDPNNVGWQYQDASQAKIIVCGSSCDRIKNDPKGSVSIILGCETILK